MAKTPRQHLRPSFKMLACLALGVLAIASETRQAAQDAAPMPLTLHVSALMDMAASAGEAGKTANAFPAMVKLFGSPPDASELRAFEENRTFVYAAAIISCGKNGPQWSRRVIFLKPSFIVVDDELLSPGSAGPPRWQLVYSPYKAEIRGNVARIRAGERTVSFETLFPRQVNHSMQRAVQALAEHEAVLEMTSLSNRRLLHVFSLDAERQRADAPLKVENDRMELTLRGRERTMHLMMPGAAAGAGEIKVTSAAGKTLLANRPFPSGIMPHTREGIRLLETWDADYREGRHPRWDTGKPSGDLTKAIEDGTIAPGRVIEFGCGTGTDAIYMASRGFDVTAIDISPSALSQALAKARKAGVSVRFMLADALNPPEIGKFDFIYDRACYHEVRGQNLNAYLETLRRTSRPGTRLLLLAGNAGGPDLGFGPPTVTEEELRFDFLPLFDIEWLRETRFEVNQSSAGLPLAWSVLMCRKAE